MKTDDLIRGMQEAEKRYGNTLPGEWQTVHPSVLSPDQVEAQYRAGLVAYKPKAEGPKVQPQVQVIRGELNIPNILAVGGTVTAGCIAYAERAMLGQLLVWILGVGLAFFMIRAWIRSIGSTSGGASKSGGGGNHYHYHYYQYNNQGPNGQQNNGR